MTGEETTGEETTGERTTTAQEAQVAPLTVSVEGEPARAYVGGRGAPLLLVHGGWGGAAATWAPVWDLLAQRFRVIAPELPGMGHGAGPALPSLSRYARWLGGLLAELKVPSAWCVGHDFGAALVWRLAARSFQQCQGLVLVDGLPLRRHPRVVRWLGRRGIGRWVAASWLRWTSHRPSALRRAFVDPARIPGEWEALLSRGISEPLSTLARVRAEGDVGPVPIVPRLFLWGEKDRLRGGGVEAARKQIGSSPGARLVLLPDAGHCPQLEQPQRFVDALEAFIAPLAEPATGLRPPPM